VRIAIRSFAAMTLMLLAISLHAEVIQLKNGNKITGTLTGISSDKFVVKTDYGEIQVPRGDIISISFTENDTTNKKFESEPQPVDESLTGIDYTNRTASFKTVVPKGWRLAPEIRQQTPSVVAALSSQDQSLFYMVTAEPFSGTIKTYEVLVETQLKSALTGYEKLDESQSSIDGRSGVHLIVHGESRAKPGTFIKFIVYILPYEGRLVRLTFFTLEPLFDEAQPVFEKIAASYGSLPHR